MSLGRVSIGFPKAQEKSYASSRVEKAHACHVLSTCSNVENMSGQVTVDPLHAPHYQGNLNAYFPFLYPLMASQYSYKSLWNE